MYCIYILKHLIAKVPYICKKNNFTLPHPPLVQLNLQKTVQIPGSYHQHHIAAYIQLNFPIQRFQIICDVFILSHF